MGPVGPVVSHLRGTANRDQVGGSASLFTPYPDHPNPRATRCCGLKELEMAAERDVQRLGAALYNGIERESKAFKLLSSMGWKEGEGLVSVARGSCMGPAASSLRHNCPGPAICALWAPAKFLHACNVLLLAATLPPCVQPAPDAALFVVWLVQGASKQGIKEHLKVKKKFDTLGMGAVSAGGSTCARLMHTHDHMRASLCGPLFDCNLPCCIVVRPVVHHPLVVDTSCDL